MDTLLAHNVENGERTIDVRIKSILPFRKMPLSSPVLKGLEQAGYMYPTDIQASAIPIGITGMDLIIQSKAGTGKTLIFSTIILQTYRSKSKEPQSLIIVPTREIALQIEDVLNRIGEYCQGFKAISVIGGMDVTEDRKRLCGAKCIVGTPGRLLHLLETNVLNTSQMRLLVFDEADRMFSKSFRSDLQKINNALIARRQIIACSATFADELDTDLAKMMRSAFLVSTSDCATALLGVKQFVFLLPEKPTSMHEMMAKLEALRLIFGRLSFKQSVLFSSSQSRADSYCNYLTKDGWPCDLLTAALNQKDRTEVFRKFRAYKTRLLLATDLMSRGIDSEHVNLVINLELPNDVVTYLHRIGRAGRFGSQGIAISFLASAKERRTFESFIKEVGGNMPVYIFPSTNPNPKEEIDFWNFAENKFFELFGAQTKLAPLASVEQLTMSEILKPTLVESDIEKESSIDTKTFHLNSKESAFNLCNLPIGSLVVPMAGMANLSIETIVTTTEQLPLSSNTIDDASSIAADSLRSSQFDVSQTQSDPPGTPVNSAARLANANGENNNKLELNPFEKCLLEQKPTIQTSQDVNPFDDYEAYMLKSDNDDSETETVEHKLNTEIIAKMESLLIDKKTIANNKMQTPVVDPFVDYESFIVPEDTSISSPINNTSKRKLNDKETFTMSAATIEEYDNSTSYSDETTATEPDKVKHLPSPANNLPTLVCRKLLNKKYKQMKLTINNVAQIAIPPHLPVTSDIDDSTMPNSSASQVTQSSFALGTFANNVGSDKSDYDQSGGSEMSDEEDDSEENYFSDENYVDDDDYEEEEEEEDENEINGDAESEEENYDEDDDNDELSEDDDDSTDYDEDSDDFNAGLEDEAINKMLDNCRNELMKAYDNYNALMSKYLKYYRQMRRSAAKKKNK